MTFENHFNGFKNYHTKCFSRQTIFVHSIQNLAFCLREPGYVVFFYNLHSSKI